MTETIEAMERLSLEAKAASELKQRTDRELAKLLLDSDIYGNAGPIGETLLSEIMTRLHRANGGSAPGWDEPHEYLEAFGCGCGHCGEPREHKLHARWCPSPIDFSCTCPPEVDCVNRET